MPTDFAARQASEDDVPASTSMQFFHAAVSRAGIDDCIEVPVDVTEELGGRGPIAVVGRVNGTPIRATLEPQTGGHYRLLLGRGVSRAAGLAAGDQVDVSLAAAPENAAPTRPTPQRADAPAATRTATPTRPPQKASRRQASKATGGATPAARAKSAPAQKAEPEPEPDVDETEPAEAETPAPSGAASADIETCTCGTRMQPGALRAGPVSLAWLGEDGSPPQLISAYRCPACGLIRMAAP